jgi:AMP-binding enzyme
VLECLQDGGTVYFAGEAEALDLIAAGAVNMVVFVVGDAERLVRDARPPPPGHRLVVWAIGSAASRSLRELIRQRLNATFFNYYSSNETGRVTCVDDDSVGTLFPGAEVRIIDEDGHDKPLGEIEFILVETKTMVDGYCNDPVLTASRFVDGWFHTLDMGTMPAPDRLVVMGRADDMLDVGGVKLSPGPIEAQIKAIDGIRDAVLLSSDAWTRPPAWSWRSRPQPAICRRLRGTLQSDHGAPYADVQINGDATVSAHRHQEGQAPGPHCHVPADAIAKRNDLMSNSGSVPWRETLHQAAGHQPPAVDQHEEDQLER